MRLRHTGNEDAGGCGSRISGRKAISGPHMPEVDPMQLGGLVRPQF